MRNALLLQAIAANDKEDELKVKSLSLPNALTRYIDKGQFHSKEGAMSVSDDKITTHVATGMRKKTKHCSDVCM